MDAIIVTILLIVIALIIIGLLPPNGVVQKVKVYGNVYHVRTVVWKKGKPIKTWYETFADDDAFNIYKENVKKEAKELYNEIKR